MSAEKVAANGSSSIGTVITSFSLSLSPPDNSQPVAHHSLSQPVSQPVSGRRWRGCGLAYTDSSSQVQQQQQQQRAHLSVSLIYNKFPAKSGHLRCIDIARLCTCSCYGEKERKRRHLWLTLAPSHRPTDWLTVASAGVVERMHRHTITHTNWHRLHRVNLPNESVSIWTTATGAVFYLRDTEIGP